MKNVLIAAAFVGQIVGCGTKPDLTTSSTSEWASQSSMEQAVRETLIPVFYEVSGVVVPFSASASVPANQVPRSFEKAQKLIHTIFPPQLSEYYRITGSSYNGRGLVLMGQDESALQDARETLNALGMLTQDSEYVQYLRHSALNIRGKVAIKFELIGQIVPLEEQNQSPAIEPQASFSAASGFNLVETSSGPGSADPCSVVAPQAELAKEVFNSLYNAEQYGLNGTSTACFDTVSIYVKSARHLQLLQDAMKRNGRLTTIAGLDIFKY